MAKNEGDFRCGPPPFARRRRSSILKPTLPLDCLGNETINPSRPLRRVSFAGHLQLKNYDKEDAGLYDELHFVPVQLGDHTSPVPPLERNEGSPLKQSFSMPTLGWDADASKFGDGMQMEVASFIHSVIQYRGNPNFLNKTVLETVDMSISGLHDKSVFFEDGEMSMSLCEASMMVGPLDSSSESVDMSLVGKSFLGEPPAADMSLSQADLSGLETTEANPAFSESVENSPSVVENSPSIADMSISQADLSSLETMEATPTFSENSPSVTENSPSVLENSPSVADMSLSQAEPSLEAEAPVSSVVESSVHAVLPAAEIPASPLTTDSPETQSSDRIQYKSLIEDNEMSMSLVTSSPFCQARIIRNEWKLAGGDASIADMSLSQASIISEDDRTLNMTTRGLGSADMSIANGTPNGAIDGCSENDIQPVHAETLPSLINEPAEKKAPSVSTTIENSPFPIASAQKSPPSSPSQHSQAMSISDSDTDRLNESSVSSDNTFDSSFDLLMQQTRKSSLEHAGIPPVSSPVLQPSDEDSTFENSNSENSPKSRASRRAATEVSSPKTFPSKEEMTADSSFHALIRTRISTFVPREFGVTSRSTTETFSRAETYSTTPETSSAALLPGNLKSTFDHPTMTPEHFKIDLQKSRHNEYPNATMDEMPGGPDTSTMDFQTFNSPRPLAGENSFMVLMQTRKSSMGQPLLFLPETQSPNRVDPHEEEERMESPNFIFSRSVLKETSVYLPTVTPLSLNQTEILENSLSNVVTPVRNEKPVVATPGQKEQSIVATSDQIGKTTVATPGGIEKSIGATPGQKGESNVATPGQEGKSVLATPDQIGKSIVATPGRNEKSIVATPDQIGKSIVATPGRNETYMSKGITDVSRLDLYKTLMDIPSMYENEGDSFPSDASPLKLGATASAMSSFASEAESASDPPMNVTRFLAEHDFLPDCGDATFVSPGHKSCIGTLDFNSTIFSPFVGVENGGDDTFSESLENISALIRPIQELLESRESSMDRSHSSPPKTISPENQSETEKLTQIENSNEIENCANDEQCPLSKTFVDHDMRECESECQIVLETTVVDQENLGVSSSDESDEEEYDSEFVQFVKSQLVDMMVYGIVEEHGVGKWTIELPGKRTVIVLFVKIPLTIDNTDQGIEQIYCAAKMLVGKISQEKLDDALFCVPKSEHFISDTVLALRTLQNQEETVMQPRPLSMRPPPAWTLV